MAQIRRAKLRCTCHGAIFERVLVRRTQEYKSIPRTTSRKSPEIAHVRRHGSLPCMPLFSPRAPLSFSRYVFIERKRIYCKIGKMLLGGKADLSRNGKALTRRKGGFITERKGVASEEKRIYHGVEKALTRRKADLSRSRKGADSEERRICHRVEKALLRRKSGFITELKRRCFGGKAIFLRSRKAVANGSGYNHNFISFSHLRGAQISRQTVRLLYFAIFT